MDKAVLDALATIQTQLGDIQSRLASLEAGKSNATEPISNNTNVNTTTTNTTVLMPSTAIAQINLNHSILSKKLDHLINVSRKFYTYLTDLPNELLSLIFGWIDPPKVFKFRILFRQLNETITSKHFAVLNVNRHLSLFQEKTLDKYWFVWPSQYQEFITAHKFGCATSIVLNGYGANSPNSFSNAKIPGGIHLLTQLTGLAISRRNLQGEIPNSLGNLINLVELDLSRNQLTGQIPQEIRLLDRLLTLNLSGYKLSGNIPTALGDLVNLQELRLRANNLSGSIPTTLAQLIRLRVLDLGSNGLEGAIPSGLSVLVDLVEMNLDSNNLTGRIPHKLSSLTSLCVLNLSRNALTGAIPIEFKELENLEILQLNDNILCGTIPVELMELTLLQELDLSMNAFTGSIPKEIANLADLTRLSLNSNKLGGSIPEGLANLDLEQLYLFENKFTGGMPRKLMKKFNGKDLEISDIHLLNLPLIIEFTSHVHASPHCPTQTTSSPPITVLIGLAVTAFVVILLIVAVVLFRKRQSVQDIERGHWKQHEATLANEGDFPSLSHRDLLIESSNDANDNGRTEAPVLGVQRADTAKSFVFVGEGTLARDQFYARGSLASEANNKEDSDGSEIQRQGDAFTLNKVTVDLGATRVRSVKADLLN
ncbi:hypothetical protein BDR26DRAFT_937149 [Obelidium mucronatum]|nr:hypothetical protein BDR26DRAFT_937149 [Obelidium mucronatum]